MKTKTKKTKKQRPTTSAKVVVQVLQNGIPIDTESYELHKKRKLTLGPKNKHDFSFPGYPDLKEIRFASIKGSEVKVVVPGSWEGFWQHETIVKDIETKPRGKHSIKLGMHDSASLHHNDLSILIRIKEERRLNIHSHKKKFRPNIATLFFHQPQELKPMFIGLTLAVLLMIPIIQRLSSIEYRKPRTLKDLNSEYVLPFTYPKHLVNLPEALQDQLDRRDYQKAAINFTESLTTMLMNWPNQYPKMLFENSSKLSRSKHIKREQSISELTAKQAAAQDEALAKAYTSVVSIPSVRGESLVGSIGRIFDKMDLMHQSLEMALANRKTTIQEFQDDPDYEFENYKQGAMKQSAKAKEALSKISPFEMLKNEEVMYATTSFLAKRALRLQLDAKKGVDPFQDNLFSSLYEPVSIPASSAQLSHLHLHTINLSDAKINSLVASEYNGSTTLQPIIKEPLIGLIEPRLIEKTVERRRFELQLCYELALKRDKGLKGEMNWSWRVDSQGKISELALVSTSINDKNMEACIRKKIAAWNFPRPQRGSIAVQYPFFFEKDRG